MDISVAKAQLRKQILARRPLSSKGLSERLIDFVQGSKIKSLASYVPLDNEPDLSAFNSWAKNHGLEIWFPKIDGAELLWGQGDLLPGGFGISEPVNGMPLPEIEVVLVPALAVDKVGNRLGKGKGFYDRALRNFQGRSFGVVFDEELIEDVPVEAHDFKLNGVITPKRSLFF